MTETVEIKGLAHQVIWRYLNNKNLESLLWALGVLEKETKVLHGGSLQSGLSLWLAFGPKECSIEDMAGDLRDPVRCKLLEADMQRSVDKGDVRVFYV